MQEERFPYIKPAQLFGLGHYEYGEAYFGSFRGTRYRLALEPLRNVHFVAIADRDPGDRLLATVWPEPFSFQDTPEDQKSSESFPVTQEGYEAAVEWINERIAAGASG